MAKRKPEAEGVIGKVEGCPGLPVFGSPDWVETHVLSKGERAAKLWRSLNATWGTNLRMLEKDWERLSKGLSV